MAIVEYTRLCGPLKAAQERMQELQREIEENERLQREKENQVGYFNHKFIAIVNFVFCCAMRY